ncbi:uncharacterized protein TNCV_1147821 [Trichonephila clavipes]|nr:uncharacterized protein TNCV_1147821 [Trichonephila clavipes]
MFAKRIDDNDTVLVSSRAETNAIYISSQMDSDRYSSLFKLILPDVNDNFIQNNIGIEFQNGNIDNSIEHVQSQVSNYLKHEQKAMEERIRRFTEQQQTNYTNLLQKVRKNKQAMLYLMIKCKESPNQGEGEAAPESSTGSPSVPNRDSGSAQSEKVGIAELTEVYHSIKHHIFYVAQDCSLKVLKQVINDSDIVKKMTGGRTKCTALVNQVLFKYSMELVQEDLKNNVPFSVATDASNKDNRKIFPVAIQYFSPKSGICHKILDFYEDSFEDSASIKERLCEVMDKSRLPWSRVTAYGADNASVNFGVNNSVFQKLKSEENDIIVAHCNDHIFHNCAKNALKVMPVDVENIVMKVFAEFSCSSKKREDLKECFDFFESEYREVIRHVPTRWLSLFKALDRMLSSWGPLKRYFIERGSDNCPTALWAILSD